MAKIDLVPVIANSTLTTINENFQKIADELQNEVLYRDNPVGETNTMENLLDMNGNRIINLPAPVALSEPVRLQDIADFEAGFVPAVLIPFSPTGDITSTNVQDAIVEVDGELHAATSTLQTNINTVQSNLNTHISNPTGAHAASAISFSPTGDVVATNVQAAIAEVDTEMHAAVAGVQSNLDAHINNTTNAHAASAITYKLDTANSLIQNLRQRLDEMVSVTSFGVSTSNTGAQNNTAMDLAIAYIISQGGGTLHFPAGTYNFASTINIAGANSLRITGAGIDATRLQINHATADFISSPGDTWYQTIDSLTLTSSVTRTAGAMFNGAASGGLWRRGMIDRVKVEKFFNGILLEGFEQSTLNDVYLVTPTGAGTAIICGRPGQSTQSGANLLILNCFLRGNVDGDPGSLPTGLVGIKVNDCQAIFCFNTDIGQYNDQCMLVSPITSTFNNYFVQTFFDGTWFGDNVRFTGAGSKDRFQFTGCWFNGAGVAWPGGSTEVAGVSFDNAGTYSDFLFSGCRFVSQQGAAVYVRTPYADFNFTGCNFNNTAAASATFRSAFFFDPASTQLRGTIIDGCKFIASSNATSDLFFNSVTRFNVIVGCTMDKGVSYQDGALWGKCAGNHDPTSVNITAADNPLITPTKDYYNLNGTANIGTLKQTYPGHKITFVTDNNVTFFDSSSLHLAGNFSAVAGSALHLVCEPVGGGWREISRVNT